MTSLTKNNLIITALGILVLSMINLDATAGCSGSRKSKNNHGHSYKSYHHRQLKKKKVNNTVTKVCHHEPQTTEPAKTEVAAKPVSNIQVVEISDPSPSDAPTQTSYMVVQENRPSSGLDVNDEINPATNRGIFDTHAQAEQTAEMWRDVMPGWEVEILEIPDKQ